jgi:L-ascorbate metabolism protein UlaG (beta-lactamase superfamily)
MVFKNSPLQNTAGAVVIPNHHCDHNAPNGAAAEKGRTRPVAVVAVPADG